MASGESSEPDRLEFWQMKWDTNKIGFHRPQVHHMLVNNAEKLYNKDGDKPSRIFVPLCGKTLDMKWFVDQGISVVGLDGVEVALEQFYAEHFLDWEKTDVTTLGLSGSVLTSKNHQFNLYCGDIFDFSVDVAGTFDAIWERGALSALQREDTKKYVEIIKSILNPGGRILMEVTEYDVSIMDDLDRPADARPPPPFPMTEADLKEHFEPECSVEFLERDDSKLAGKDIHMALYLIVKN